MANPMTRVRIGHVQMYVHDHGETGADVDSYGISWGAHQLDGWEDGWEGNGALDQRTQADGAWINPLYASSRLIHLGGTLEDTVGNSWDAATAAWRRLLGQIPFRALGPMYVSTGEGTLPELVAMIRQHERPAIQDRFAGRIDFTLSLVAPDPRRYATTVQTTVLVLPLASGGVAPPLTPPLTITGSTTVSTATLTNAGNVDTYPVLSIAGPCPPCTITNLTTSEALRVVDAIPAGQTLVIDVGAGTALIQGQSRKVLGTWWSLRPGDNQVSFVADSYDAGAALTITHRSAWK